MTFKLPHNFNPAHGLTRTIDARKSAQQVTLTYDGKQMTMPSDIKEMAVEVEVYDKPGGGYLVHSACPKCRHAIKIDSDNKEIALDPKRGLFVEPFTCPWEMGDAMAAGDRRIEFGLGMCNMRVAYDGFKIKDA